MGAADVPHPLPEPLIEEMSERMALLAHPSRIRILDALRDGERNVQSISDTLFTTQQNVSGHLRLLRAAGIVSRRPAGREAFYTLADETVFTVWAQLLGGLRQQPMCSLGRAPAYKRPPDNQP